MVIPKFFRACREGKPLIVHGDGTQQRIFCHVADAISGTLALWDSSKGNGEVFNLGGIEEVRIIDLAKRILEVTGSPSKIEFLSYQVLRLEGFEDMSRRLPDTSKLQSATGWKAELGLKKILSDYLEYAKSIWQ
jgi:UDP-glucose 4-epimerase